MRWNKTGLRVTAALAFAVVTVSAQSGVDPTLLAKANDGDAAAQVQVGEAYAEGQGVARDPKQAVAWYRKAADRGYIDAELRLAVLYRDGAGKTFPRDMTQAVQWYREAADQGDNGAQGALGMLYTLGQGVPRSDVEAYFWLDLAASAPGPNQVQYIANRQNVGTHLTADDLDSIHEPHRNSSHRTISALHGVFFRRPAAFRLCRSCMRRISFSFAKWLPAIVCCASGL